MGRRHETFLFKSPSRDHPGTKRLPVTMRCGDQTIVQRINREQSRKYAFDWEDEPLLRVKCGESFEIETYDASTGYFKTEADKAIPGRRPGFDRTPPHANPIGGPVWLEGAER